MTTTRATHQTFDPCLSILLLSAVALLLACGTQPSPNTPEIADGQVDLNLTQSASHVTVEVQGEMLFSADFYLDDALSPFHTATASPFSATLATGGLQAGAHRIRVVAAVSLLDAMSTVTRYADFEVDTGDTTGDPEPDQTSTSEILNNTQWYDDKGTEIRSNDGGHIAQFGDTFYWVGNDLNLSANGMDIHLYSSKSLGSADWKWEGKMVDFSPGTYNGNCTLVKCPSTGKYLIISKGLRFYESDSITGPYTLAKTIWPSQSPFHPKHRWGGMSIYQENDDAYLVVSRYATIDGSFERKMAIYKLTPDYKGIEKEILWSDDGRQREAPWIFKKDNQYYMTMSHCRGWKPSETYYWTADSLSGPWTVQGQVGMNPGSKKSHNTQHRYIMLVGDQWIFGGDRYPYHEPSLYPKNEGQNIICPVTWDGDKPVVHFEKTWTITIQ